MLYAGNYELRHSVRGQPVYLWKKSVPRILEVFLNSVVYLYPSAGDADAGTAAGGTGFVISVPSEAHEGYGYEYCVTNSHVIREAEGNSPIIRLNTKDGGRDVIETGQEHWVHHQDGDDLAVCLLALADTDYFKYSALPHTFFLTEEYMKQQSIGPGDEVLMVGRFATQEGRQQNTPVVRFGNISMMPWEPIMHGRGYTVESFLIETRSLSGFSGSPVFVYHAPTTPYPQNLPPREQGTWLLGVDWGHLPIYEKVKEKNRKDDVPEGWVVQSNSGQMAVAPAWKLQELLDQEELVVQRKAADEDLAKRRESSPVVLDMLSENTGQTERPAQNPEPFAKKDFEDTLDRVSRPVSPPDPEK